MSIEIDILNGDASWPLAEPLLQGGLAARRRRKAALGPHQMGPCRPARADRSARGRWPCLSRRHLLQDGDLERPQVSHRRHRRGFDPRRLPPPRLCQHRARRGDPDHARSRSRAVRASVLRAAQFRVLSVARLAPLHRRDLRRAARLEKSASRRWRPSSSISSGARRGKAPSTYAACPGDLCAGRGGIGSARLIICHS